MAPKAWEMSRQVLLCLGVVQCWLTDCPYSSLPTFTSLSKTCVDSRNVNSSSCKTWSVTAPAGRGAPSGLRQGEPVEDLISYLASKIRVIIRYGWASPWQDCALRGALASLPPFWLCQWWLNALLFGFILNALEKSSAIHFRSDKAFCFICSVFCWKLILTLTCLFPSLTGSERSFQIQLSCLGLLLHPVLCGQIWFALLHPHGIEQGVWIEDIENLVCAEGVFPNVDPKTGTVFQLFCQRCNFQCSPN